MYVAVGYKEQLYFAGVVPFLKLKTGKMLSKGTEVVNHLGYYTVM
jgi:hypothetical protein